MNKTSSAFVRTLLLGTSCLTVLSLGAAKADPTGGTVVTGSATIASHGNSTTINQSTNRALINWDSFSIAAGGQVRFNQPGTGSITLNRVIGSAPSSIYGSILANGQVWLINSNGILFGKGAQVNVGGLLATTSNISDGDFANGNFNFSGGTGASVVNQGTIHARNGGSVVLSGSSVQNQGLIQADAGTVVLGGASAFTVDFDGDNLLRYAIAAPAGKADNGQTGVSNSGTINANNGGRVIMTARAAADIAGAVINNTGIVTATSAKVQNGEVVLDGGDGDVNVGGTITATGNGNGQTGGFVDVSGHNITVADNARIDVSGSNGGGTVHIGGDLHGAGPLPNAANVTVGSATIKADATRKGNGGTLVVWSNGLTDFSGIFSAMGGAAGGDGGLIETSGHHLHVGDGAKVDTTAPRGNTGTWLLDPDYIDISNGGDGTIDGSGVVHAGDDPSYDVIAPSTIVNALDTTNVRLEANYDIGVYDDINYNSAHTLSMLAGGNIYIAANVQNAGSGAINVIAGWDGETIDPAHFTDDGVYGKNGGSVYVTSDYDLDPGEDPSSEAEEGEVHPVAIGSAGGTTTIAGADVNVLGIYASSQIGYTGAGGGDIVVRANGNVTLDGSFGYDAIIGNGGSGATGDVTGNIDVRGGGTLGLYNGDSGALVWIGNLAGGDFGETGNVTLVAGSGDSDFDFSHIIAADLAGGDFTLGTTDDSLDAPGLVYNSAHTLNLLSVSDINVSNTIQNSGSGAINLVAGWDGVTLDPAHFGDDLVYGNFGGTVGIGGPDAEGDVFVGSAHGPLNIYADTVIAEAVFGNVQLGYHGAGGGDINVLATSDVVLSAQDNNIGTYSVMIGNGALDGSVGGQITGNIFVHAQGELSLGVFTGEGCGCDDQLPPGDRGGSNFPAPQRLLGIGNGSAIDEPAATGTVAIFSGSVSEDQSGMLADIVGADLSYGDVTIGHLDSETPMLTLGDFGYSSSHTLTLLSEGDIDVSGNLQNSGSGAITLIAGWDGNYDPAHLTDAGHYGLNNGTIVVGGENAEGDTVVGTAQGDLNLFGANLNIDAFNGAAQVGYHGAGGGNIFVTMTGNITGSGGNEIGDGEIYNAQLGNGSLYNDVTGDITGNISLKAGGFTAFSNGDTGQAWLGNVAGDGFVETGDVTALTVSGFFRGDYIAADLGTAPGTGGNVFIGFTDPEVTPIFIGGVNYSSPNAFTFAGAGSMNVTGSVQNAGTGDVTLVAGWDGHTVGSAAQLQAAHAYGIGGGSITVGSENQFQDAAVGSAGGLTTLLTSDLTVAPSEGFYAQVGYHGATGGDIRIVADGDLTLTAGSDSHDYAMIGNGSRNGDVTGDVGGDIDIRVEFGATHLADGEGARAWIGNVTGGSGKAHGNITLVTDFGGVPKDMIAADLGTSADTGGDFFLGYVDANDGAVGFGGLTYNSPHNFTIAAAADLEINGFIQNAGSGAVTLVAGWDETTFGSAADLQAAHAYGLNNATLLIGDTIDTAAGSAGGVTTALTDHLVFSSNSGYAQIGFHGAGGGDIVIVADGDLTMNGGADPHDYAMIGNGSLNGDVTGNVTGNIDIHVGATTTMTQAEGGAAAWIGNVAAEGNSASGNIQLVTGDFDGPATMSGMIAADLAGGDFTFGVTDPDADIGIDKPVIYNSSHTFNLLSAGSFDILGSIQNGGSGAINIVAGWDGTTLDAAHFFDPGHYANNGGAVHIGGELADDNVAVGSAGGATNIGGSAITLTAVNGYAQVGYHGLTGGAINLFSTGAVTLSGIADTPEWAMIGNGQVFGSSDGGGDVTIDAASIQGGDRTAVAGANLVLETTGGNIGSADAVLQIAAHTLQISTVGGSVFLTSPDQGVTFAGSGVNTGGGVFSLDAGGAIDQTAAIHTGQTHLATSAGDITLMNSGNAFGGLTIATPGNASLAHSSLLTIAGANIGGLLTLRAHGSINQSGAIVAGALDVAAGVASPSPPQTQQQNQPGGSIVLTNAGNSFATLTVSTLNANDATVVDSSAVVLGGATVGGTFTLTAGGAISQSGALLATNLNVTTTAGNIAFTNTANAVTGTVQFSTPGSATFYDTSSMNVATTTVGGDLTLLSKGNINFRNSYQSLAGNITVVAGWDGVTVAPASFGNAGVYGNNTGPNTGNIVIGGTGATGAVAVGSKNGSTRLYANNLTVAGVNGMAQLGYHGSGGGDINVFALNNVSVLGSGATFAAQIGNGGLDVGGIVGGAVSVMSGSLTLTASAASSSALVGNAGGTNASEGGNVTINTHGGALTLASSGVTSHAHVGNWTNGNTTGTSSGDIAIDAGAVTLAATANGSYSQIGNGAFRFGYDSGALSGNIVIHATTFLASAIGNSQARVGNLGTGVVNGDLSLITTGNVALTGIGGLVNIGNVSGPFDSHGTPLQGQASGALLVQSGGTLALTAQDGGNARIETGGATSGTVNVSAVGDITLSAGTPSSTGSNAFAFIGALLAGNGGANISVHSANGGVYLTASESGGTARIGNQQNGDLGGTLSGTVAVTASNSANGNVSLSATGANALTAIGNVGFNNETVGGDITVIAGKTVTFGAGDDVIGNSNSNPQGDGSVPAPFSGNVTVTAWSIAGDSGGLFGDLAGGDVTIGLTDPGAQIGLSHGFLYNSSHNLSILTAGSIGILASIQNAGSGAINVVAGWDGHSLDPAHFFDPGHYGNNGGTVLVGSQYAQGNVAIGSFGGATNIGAASITLAGVNGYAQVGYRGSNGGAIGLHALGNVTLTSGVAAPDWAQIGNGLMFGSNAAGGDVSVTAAAIQGNANTAVTGANLSLSATSGNIGASGAALHIASASLAVSTFGGSVFLTSPDQGVTFAGTGINTGGGGFSLDAGGAIGQTAAIHTGQTHIATTSGDITLMDSGNAFGGLTVATPGNASLAHSSLLTIAGANIGGTLTLRASGSISQTGAIVASAVDVTAGVAAPGESGQQNLPPGGTVVLTNAGNSFGTLTVHTFNGNDATIADAGAVVLAGVGVANGKFTLTAGGAISQSGAIVAGQSVISTISGDITLTNAGNAFGPLTVVTPGNASLTQASLMTVTSATIGGALTLNAGSIAQSGAIVAASLSATSSAGGIVLANTGNSFGTLSVHTTGPNDATVVDSTAVVIAASAVGGKFTLSAGGGVSQSGAIAAQSLNVTTTAGNIAFTNTANAVTGTVQFSTPGSATFYDTSSMNVATTTVGGDLTLLSKGNVNFRNSVQSTTGNITVVAGWDGVTVAPASFGNAGVYGNNTSPNTGNIFIGGTGATGAVSVGSKSGTTSLYANNLGVFGVNGAAQLGYHGSGGGAILVRTLHDVTIGANGFSAMIGNGSLTSDVTGNETGDIDLRMGGNLVFSGSSQTWLGNFAHSGSETGNLVAVMNDVDDSSDHHFSDYIAAALGGGDVTIGFTGSDDQGPGNAVAFNTAHTLNILSVGNFVVAGSIQNSGTGAINLVAGWDGHTLNAASFGTAGVYGNNGKGLIVGGTNAAGNAAFGSAGGTTTIYAASLTLSAMHGYAQLGFNGHGSGAIVVNTTGGVSLTGGAGTNQFAQIGNGGQGTSGNNSGAITINAGGDLVLTAGAGSEAYAQLGHGGAESNTGANGYSNVAPITVTAANVLMNPGTGNAAYVQIGNGGYKSGLNLAGGTAVNGGAITITSGHAVSLTGNGADAYAQIGNGGSQSNANAAAAAGGSDSGDIVVHAPNGAAGAVTLTAGSGGNAYSQIGNGGYGANAGPTTTVANFTISGNVFVTDLALTGGSPGLNAYSQIGNGDASHNSTGNISGNITIDANGQITYTPGGNPHSQATIGNFTGQGTVTGTVSGATPPPDLLGDPGVIGVVVNNTAGNDSPTDHNNGITTIQTLVVAEQEPGGNSAVTLEQAMPGPLASLDQNSSDNESSHASDSATVVIADSLDGARKAGATTILQGMLKAAPGGAGVHAIPPADQDFSSWGNEALWQ